MPCSSILFVFQCRKTPAEWIVFRDEDDEDESR